MKNALNASVLLVVTTLFLASVCQGQAIGSIVSVSSPAQATEMPPPQGCSNTPKQRVSGNGRFVAVGNDGKLRYSADGTVWREAYIPMEDFIRGVTFGNGRFVAVGGSYASHSSIILTSNNGARWTVERCPAKQVLYSVAYGQGRFVAVGGEVRPRRVRRGRR